MTASSSLNIMRHQLGSVSFLVGGKAGLEISVLARRLFVQRIVHLLVSWIWNMRCRGCALLIIVVVKVRVLTALRLSTRSV